MLKKTKEKEPVRLEKLIGNRLFIYSEPPLNQCIEVYTKELDVHKQEFLKLEYYKTKMDTMGYSGVTFDFLIGVSFPELLEKK